MDHPPPASFPPTCWTVIRDAQSGDARARTAALDRLLSVYWQPVYWSIRNEWNIAPEDARDLTQGYFTSFLERDLVHSIAADRGRFRAYVKATLKNWMLAWRRDAATLKRGGGVHLVALDDLERSEPEPANGEPSPEKRFERELMRSILARALAELRDACGREGKSGHFALFLRFYGLEAEGRAPSYGDLMAEFGLSQHDVKNRLAALRARFRDRVLALLRDGLSSDADLLGEIRAVFS